MSKNCPIMKRMKRNYEFPSTFYLTKRTPIIIRLDGKNFSTFTKKNFKPFSLSFLYAMENTATYLVNNIQGAKLAYVQSDEISILITDYDNLDTQAWFDYNLNKLCSISASMCSVVFNKEINRFRPNSPPAFFDSRAFNIPKEEVSNYFIARYRDAKRNSIMRWAQRLFSHKELHKKNTTEILKMCKEKKNPWEEDCTKPLREGSLVFPNSTPEEIELNSRNFPNFEFFEPLINFKYD